MTENKRILIDHKAKWYFGGVASATASMFTHPFSVIRIPIQTRRTKISVNEITRQIIRTHGITGLYNGFSAELMRHLSYSLLRFSIYDLMQEILMSTTVLGKIASAGVSGCIGGFAGTPATKIGIRMINDMVLTKHNRRNYKHALDAYTQIYDKEGFKGLFTGGGLNTARGALFTIAQVGLYDELANNVIRKGGDHNNVKTHFQASLISGVVASLIAEPFLVIRTRLMQDFPKGKKGLFEIIRFTALYGHHKFYRGFFLTFIQIVPNTIFSFMLLEQLRINFGIPVEVEIKDAPTS